MAEPLTHLDLCERAIRWLSGTRMCHPVYTSNASCAEIPDAIGWSSHHRWHGSTVVECKTSVSDFHADKKKWVYYREPKYGWEYPGKRISQKEATINNYELLERPRMGDYRFFMCPPNILALSLIEKHAPDHGLLYAEGRRVRIIRDAPRREKVNYPGEIRYLRFAIINSKEPFLAAEQVSLPEGDGR